MSIMFVNYKKSKKKQTKIITNTPTVAEEHKSPQQAPSYSINSETHQSPIPHQEQNNLYKSCLESSGTSGCAGDSSDTLLRVHEIIEDSLESLLDEVTDQSTLYTSLLERAEPPFTPTTMTLWRRLTLKKVRKCLESDQKGVRIEQAMTAFSKRVDLELLDHRYLSELIRIYQIKLKQPMQHQAPQQVPKNLINFERYLDIIKQSSSYDRLISVLSNWLALMELCDDLLERLQIYGHAQYLDIKHAQQSLREHWQTTPHDYSLTNQALDKGKSLISATASKAALKLSGMLHMIGIVGTIHTQVIKYLFGFYFAHPAVFVGSIVAAVVLKYLNQSIEESQLISEVDQICENLQIVTSNLRAHYTHASETLAHSFTNPDGGQQVLESVHRLLEGAQKDNGASLQRHYDERDKMFEKLEMELEAEGGAGAGDEWVSVKVVQDHFRQTKK